MRIRHVWTGATGALAPRALALQLDALTTWNGILLRELHLPDLYSTGVRYQREDYDGPHPEDWRDALEVIRLGGGDCEDLAAYRCADLRRSGRRNARCIFSERARGSGRLFHIYVEVDTGGPYEDPARNLGMISPE